MRGWLIGSIVGSMVVLLFVYCVYFSGGGVESYRYLNQPIVAGWGQTYPVYIEFTLEEEMEEIEEAIGRWNRVLNGYRRLEVVDRRYSSERLEVTRRAVSGEAYLILRLEPDSDLLNDGVNEMTLAFVNELGGTLMYIVPTSIREGDVSVYSVVLHEIGHWMGAGHVESGLMEAKYRVGGYICVDEGTVRQVSGWFKVYDWRRMNYCVREVRGTE